MSYKSATPQQIRDSIRESGNVSELLTKLRRLRCHESTGCPASGLITAIKVQNIISKKKGIPMGDLIVTENTFGMFNAINSITHSVFNIMNNDRSLVLYFVNNDR